MTWPCLSLQNVCHTLWCSVGTTCHSKLDAAVDGTRCGENKVGRSREVGLALDYLPLSIPLVSPGNALCPASGV